MENDYREKMRQEAGAIIEKMANNELLINNIYERYSVLFPSYEAFWKELATEEKIHQGWLNVLMKKVGNGEVFFNPERFKKEAIDEMARHLKLILDDANNQEKSIELINALSTALDLEQSLLENRFFEVFESDSIEIKNTLENLRVNTEEHRDKVKRIWDQKRVRESAK